MKKFEKAASASHCKTTRKYTLTTWICLGICLGLSLGILIGICMDDVGLGLCLGLGVGLAANCIAGGKRKKGEERR